MLFAMDTINKIMKIIYYITIFTSILIMSCNDYHSSNTNKEEIKVNLSNKSKEISSKIIKNIKYITVNDDISNEYLLSRIEKLVMYKNTIYVADGYMKKVLSIDFSGNILKKFGKIGNGPGEYLSVTDIYVSKNGNINICDSKERKIHVYDSNARFIKDENFNFIPENICELDNNTFLFSLAPYNDKNLNKAQLIVTDQRYNIIKTEIKYKNNVDIDIYINSSFINADGYIAYNRIIDNNVYLISENGKLNKIFSFNFGNKTIPLDKIGDMKTIMHHINDYCFLISTPIITKKYIFFNIKDGEEMYSCIYDRKSKDVEYHKVSESKSNNTILPMYYSNESNSLISVFNEDMIPDYDRKGFPKEVSDHIKGGKIIIALYQIN